ncbi:MAG: hypothetical protein ABI193_06355 [Minicystis sp.]
MILPSSRSLRFLLCAGAIPLSALLAGCPDDPNPPADAGPDAHGCMLPYLGDKTKDMELEVLILGPSNASTVLHDGDMVPLVFPPQGGEVIFAGARATNVDPCGVKISGALRDLDTKLIQVDARTVNLDDDGDGWGRSTDSDISSFANISVCPNNWSKTNINNTKYELELTVTDRDKRSVTKRLQITPFCAEEAYLEFCTCTCKGGYILGQTCDGGAGGGNGTGGNHP